MILQNKLYILILCWFIAIVSYGQEISGYVHELNEQHNKIPLTGANIYWDGTQQGTVSDENGKFTISISEKLPKALITSFVGYVNDTTSVLNGQEKIEVVLSINKTLDEFVVSERQQSSFVSQIDPLLVQNITGAELTKAACCNLSESFETNASVDVSISDAVSGAKKIELLGLHGKYSQLMTENIPNLRGLAITYGLGYIPGSWMESIQISKGTSSVVNGYESTTGQINIEYKKPDGEEKLYLNAYANQIGKFEGNFNGRVKINDKWSTMLLAHGETFNNKIDNNGDSFIDVPLIQQYNLLNRWKYFGDNFRTQFGFQVLEENRNAGQTGFNIGENPGNSTYYGVNIKTERYQAWGKVGYVFENNPSTSIGFINSYTYHEMSSFYGLTTYDGIENTYYANLVLQSQLGSCKHKYSTGISYLYDNYQENLNDGSFNRTESVPGLFFQYTYSNEKNLTILLGIRTDFHNIWGTFYTPRVHVRYNLFTNTTLRASAGKGYRTAKIISENNFMLASSRKVIVYPGIQQEEAWNYGINLTQLVEINKRDLNLNIEFYRTDFINQVVIDLDSDVLEVNIYNLNGKSYSNSYQVEAVYELIPRLEATIAFRYNDVKMTYNDTLEREPLVNRYKGLLNLSYKTNLNKWQFDFTTLVNGDARLPNTSTNPPEYQRPDNSPVYTILNAQVTKYFKKWNIYAGVENLTGFTQSNPIIAADDPFGPYFDSSIVWGPIMGRKIYLGLKFEI